MKEKQPSKSLPVDSHSVTPNVPAFTCIVYVSQVDRGVLARVANLAGIEFQAGTERDALAKIVPAFKKLVAETLESGKTVDWIDPPVPIGEGEVERYLPVHL